MVVSRIQMATEGPEVSRLVVGLMRLNEWGYSNHETLDWIHANLDLGITTFDHADIYGGYSNEARFGDALKLDPSVRQRMELITKCGIQLLADARPETYVKHYNTSSEYIIRSAEASLHHLQTDVLDVFLIHRPDPLMNADEIAEAFTTLRDAGKVKHVGVSNFTPHQFDLVQSRLAFPLVTNQVECSVLQMEPMDNGVFDQCQQRRISPMIWSPLAGGRIFQPRNEREQYVQHTLRAVGEELGNPPLECVALAWLLRHPAGLIPVLGTGKMERIEAAIQAIALEMDRQQWFRIREASAGHEVP